MLSVAVHKDIAEYQPKIVGKMTMRTLVSITGALSVSVLAGLYIYFVLGLNVSDCTYFIYAVSLPFWCVGFVKPCGMPFEQFAPLWLKANFTNDRIFYKPSMRLAGLLSESENSKQKGTIYGKHYRKQGNLRGIESYDTSQDAARFPGGQFVSRYYMTDLLEDNSIAVSLDTMLKNGNQFSLDGGIPAWTVEGDDLAKVNDFLKKSCMEFCGSLPGDEKDEDGYSLTGEAKDATASRNGLSRNQMGIEEKAAECKEAATVLANGDAL